MDQREQRKGQGANNRRKKKRYRGKTNKHRNRAASRNGRIKKQGNSLKVKACPICYHGLSIRLEHKKEFQREIQGSTNKYVL